MEHVEREARVPAPPDAVWPALVVPERLGVWLGGEVDLEVRPGAFGSFRSANGEVRRVVVLGVDDGRELTFRWWPETDAGAASTVEITVREADDGESTVRVRETRAQALLATA